MLVLTGHSDVLCHEQRRDLVKVMAFYNVPYLYKSRDGADRGCNVDLMNIAFLHLGVRRFAWRTSANAADMAAMVRKGKTGRPLIDKLSFFSLRSPIGRWTSGL